jgi:short-subunit dehydrogenase
MASVKGKRVLITGAASGIGYCTAEYFARAGSELVLGDINGDELREAAKQLRALGATVHTYVYDVSKQKQVQDVIAKINRKIGGIDILINNAGVGYTGELANTSLATWRKLVAVNLWGPLYHVYAVLPQMKQRRSGHIVNVSSGQSFFRLPTWGAYASIKAALGAFSEILYFELRKYKIDVTTVYPFMVNTPFYNEIEGTTWAGRLSMKLVPYYSMSPERVGKIIFKAVKRRRKVELVSIFNDVGFYAQMVPLAPDVIARVSNFFLAESAEPAEA